MFCEHCGKEVLKDAKFCGSCGQKVEGANANTQNTPPVTAQTTQQNTPTQNNIPAAAPVNQQESHIPPQQTYYATQRSTSPLSVKDYLIMFFLMIIPFVNIILPFIWAFSSTENLNKSNYAKAMLIYLLIVIAVMIVFSIVFGAIIAGLMASSDFSFYN